MRPISLIILFALAINAFPVPTLEEDLSDLLEDTVRTVTGLLGLPFDDDDFHVDGEPVCEFKQFFCVGHCMSECFQDPKDCFDCLTTCRDDYKCNDSEDDDNTTSSTDTTDDDTDTNGEDKGNSDIKNTNLRANNSTKDHHLTLLSEPPKSQTS